MEAQALADLLVVLPFRNAAYCQFRGVGDAERAAKLK